MAAEEPQRCSTHSDRGGFSFVEERILSEDFRSYLPFAMKFLDKLEIWDGSGTWKAANTVEKSKNGNVNIIPDRSDRHVNHCSLESKGEDKSI